mmetsp:Transcript_35982/g.80928  ORF Transcript_35982/g.80928 Transcript_35982/m.80928 type:complete len:213 (+) Transcript_35982:308-946(+)
MPESHRAAVDINSRGVEIQELHVGQCHHAESFVDLVKIAVAQLKTGLLQRQRHGQGRRGCKVHRGLFGVCEAPDSGQGLEPELRRPLVRHDHHGRRAVVDRRGVASRHRAALSHEGGPELGDFRFFNGARFFVEGHYNRCVFAPNASDLDRHHFQVENTLGLSFLRPRIRFETIRILIRAAYCVIACALFGAHAHVLVPVGIPEPVVNDAVQ